MGIPELRALPFYHQQALRVFEIGAEAVSDGHNTSTKHQANQKRGLRGRTHPFLPFFPLPISFLGSVAQSSSGHTAAERTTRRLQDLRPAVTASGTFPSPRGKSRIALSPVLSLAKGELGRGSILGRALRLRVSSFLSRKLIIGFSGSGDGRKRQSKTGFSGFSSAFLFRRGTAYN